MNELVNIPADHFQNALAACQEFVPDFPPPIRQTVWVYKGKPRLLKVEYLSQTTRYFAVRQSAQSKAGRAI